MLNGPLYFCLLERLWQWLKAALGPLYNNNNNNNHNNNNNNNIYYARDREQRKLVRAESRAHEDIVQGDYDDAEEAAKTLNGILWLATHCAMVGV